MEVEAMVRPVVEAVGLELLDVALTREQGRRVLRITVDRPEGDGRLDLDSISEASERISRRLDLEGFDLPGGRYSLEVSSPGVERPLRDPRDFARRVGEKVNVKTVRPVDGTRRLVGTIVEATADFVRLRTETGECEVPFGEIAWARTVFEWGNQGITRREGVER
jgi:ribosome maturation factor RimP